MPPIRMAPPLSSSARPGMAFAFSHRTSAFVLLTAMANAGPVQSVQLVGLWALAIAHALQLSFPNWTRFSRSVLLSPLIALLRPELLATNMSVVLRLVVLDYPLAPRLRPTYPLPCRTRNWVLLSSAPMPFVLIPCSAKLQVPTLIPLRLATAANWTLLANALHARMAPVVGLATSVPLMATSQATMTASPEHPLRTPSLLTF